MKESVTGPPVIDYRSQQLAPGSAWAMVGWFDIVAGCIALALLLIGAFRYFDTPELPLNNSIELSISLDLARTRGILVMACGLLVGILAALLKIVHNTRK